MDYMPSTLYQTVGFLYSSGLGFCLGIVYDLFRIFFYLLTGSDKKLTALRNIIYLLVCLAAAFLFLLVMCAGQAVFYAFAGGAAGAVIYFFTLSDMIYIPVRQFIRKNRIRIIKVFGKIKIKFSEFSTKINKKFGKRRIKRKISKKGLQKRPEIVYNFPIKLRFYDLFFRNRGDSSVKEEKTKR